MTALTAATRLSLSLIAGGAVRQHLLQPALLGLLAQVFGHDASVLVPTATLAATASASSASCRSATPCRGAA